MSGLVACVRSVVTHADGAVFEEFYDWQGGRTDFEVEMEHIRYVKVSPVVKVMKFVVSEGGAAVEFPVAGTPCILLDRTGVLVVFDKEPSKFSCPEAPWFFGFPNNAAIYNADGSLRFQLHNPEGENSYIGAIHTGAMPDHPDTLGVLVGTIGHDPEWLYLVDCNSPEIISTGKWIRY